MGLLEILYTKIASFENSLSTRDFRTSLSGSIGPIETIKRLTLQGLSKMSLSLINQDDHHATQQPFSQFARRLCVWRQWKLCRSRCSDRPMSIAPPAQPVG